MSEPTYTLCFRDEESGKIVGLTPPLSAEVLNRLVILENNLVEGGALVTEGTVYFSLVSCTGAPVEQTDEAPHFARQVGHLGVIKGGKGREPANSCSDVGEAPGDG
ncbi:MAG: hypothetical protein KGL39_36990 [Patescibacteria group bacterium]|nr:hypothetical protein [Patescibacteria group bacterium]